MSVRAQVEEILDKLRPYIHRDGGDVLLEDVDGGVVYLQLVGACSSCPASYVTLKALIEESIKEEIPEITEVQHVSY